MLKPMRNSRLLNPALSAICAVCTAGGLLTFAFRAALAAGGNKQSDLSGTWVLQAPDPKLTRWTFSLKDDGTFTEHMTNYVMVTVISDSSGRYTRNGNILTLTGVRKGYRDDGYVKGPFKDPFTLKLKYAHNYLTLLDDPKADMVFRREGAHAPPEPKPRLRPSDPRALQIVREMRSRYAALDSYSDEGTLTSSGAGFMWANARFQTRFSRPHKFRFEGVAVADGKEWDRNVVWSDGKKTWLYMESVGGSDERGLGNALSTISVTSGDETMLVPSLLLPLDFHGPMIDPAFEQISIVGEVKVSGKDCDVIGVGNPGGVRLKLWIEKSTHLILRAYDGMPKATITYQPKCNVKIADSEFNFSPPK